MSYVPDHHARERRLPGQVGLAKENDPSRRSNQPVGGTPPKPTGMSSGGGHTPPKTNRESEDASKSGEEILKRIKKWRDRADATGLFPRAVGALDHYLDKSGTFVEIPKTKVDSVRALSERTHMEQAIARIRVAAIQEAAAVWLAQQGYPKSGGKMSPRSVEIVLRWQSGVPTSGLTDDNLTYYGTMILSEITLRVEQTSEPKGLEDGPVTFQLSVIQWKSWAVDNYDWEGDKKFGFFTKLGLPTQREMNTLQQLGLAKPFQRSSKSWLNKSHGMEPWEESAFSLAALVKAGKDREIHNKRQEKVRESEVDAGALPTPPPAEIVKATEK